MSKTRSKRSYLGISDRDESWLNRTWRPAAAIVYLAICLFDFILAPAFMGFKSSNIAQLAGSVKGLDPAVAIAIIQNRTPWQPLTLQGSGLFHVAFGAILGVAAWTRGYAQVEQIRQQGEYDRSPYTPTPYTAYFPPAQSQVGQPYPGQPQQPFQNNVIVQPAPIQQSDSSVQPDNPDA